MYIGRPSPWGNPYLLRDEQDRRQVIERYVAYLETMPELVRQARHELREKHLLCWCAPLMCHGDVLALVADGLSPELAGAVVLGHESEEDAWEMEREAEMHDAWVDQGYEHDRG